jgi:hypothetical protein
MDYSKNYYNYIAYVKTLNRSRADNVYYEEHHIIPKSVGGEDNPDNLVLLTAREHFLAHYLLTKIYLIPKQKAKMIFAFMCMQLMTPAQLGNRYMNSRLFEKVKLENSFCLSRYRAPRHWTEEQKARVTGRKKPPFTAHKEKIRQFHLGLKQTSETIQKRVEKNNKPVRCILTLERCFSL